MSETKKPSDFITDGVLNYGVNVGRFVFANTGKTVYAVSDLPHIGASDVFMLYQISRLDHRRLVGMSLPDRIPEPPVPAALTDACRRRFLCGESAYCKRNSFTVFDADSALIDDADKAPAQPSTVTMDSIARTVIDPAHRYLYLGESERAFLLTFTQAVGCGRRDDDGGVIIVPKEYENEWIAKRQTYHGWRVVIADVAKQYIKGAARARWKFIEEGMLTTLCPDMRYIILSRPDGTVIGQTVNSTCELAPSVEEYRRIPPEKLECMLYSSEMGRSR